MNWQRDAAAEPEPEGEGEDEEPTNTALYELRVAGIGID